ncbi:unnamed protein product [Closterium sp. NIES-64]|nr:unnamed protein product [Closterium sp. NIES-64]
MSPSISLTISPSSQALPHSLINTPSPIPVIDITGRRYYIPNINDLNRLSWRISPLVPLSLAPPPLVFSSPPVAVPPFSLTVPPFILSTFPHTRLSSPHTSLRPSLHPSCSYRLLSSQQTPLLSPSPSPSPSLHNHPSFSPFLRSPSTLQV